MVRYFIYSIWEKNAHWSDLNLWKERDGGGFLLELTVMLRKNGTRDNLEHSVINKIDTPSTQQKIRNSFSLYFDYLPDVLDPNSWDNNR